MGAAGAAMALAVALPTLSGCAGGPPATMPPASTAEDSDSSATATVVTSEIVGYWHRAQSCEELLATFEAAGLAESHSGWLQGNFYGGGEGPTSGDLCVGAEGPLEHSHWFTETGEFGSHDQAGEQVDGGDYVLVDSDTLAFPSHSAEFGHDGEILVDFTVDDGVAVFQVHVPDPCDAPCQDAHAWALSAFSSGPWATGDVP
ncbi:hypothetical protein ACFQ58_10475 [Agromyces sp. NPDC056523]|uniref:hypothetical protein n=1 Tax=Agromyces sp. NPDC056523 TaxID=3345850 RepID=UPI003670DA85